jgi:hypothetical protein
MRIHTCKNKQDQSLVDGLPLFDPSSGSSVDSRPVFEYPNQSRNRLSVMKDERVEWVCEWATTGPAAHLAARGAADEEGR